MDAKDLRGGAAASIMVSYYLYRSSSTTEGVHVLSGAKEVAGGVNFASAINLMISGVICASLTDARRKDKAMPHSALEKLREVTTSDALFKLNAVAYKKTFDALIAEGFTREMAVQIVASRGPAINVNGNGSGK